MSNLDDLNSAIHKYLCSAKSYGVGIKEDFTAGWQAACELKDNEIKKLGEVINAANTQTEHFEREWYLRGDELEILRTLLAETNAATESACAKLESYRRLFDEASAAAEENRNLRNELAKFQGSQFHPDWSLLQACREALHDVNAEFAGLNTEYDALKNAHAHNLAMHEITMQQRDAARNELDELTDFAFWMTGCGYDFCQHEYFVKNRHLMARSRPVPEIPESASQAIGIVPVPEGYALVPAEPTVGMIRIGACVRDDALVIGEFASVKSIYKAMISAAQKEAKP